MPIVILVTLQIAVMTFISMSLVGGDEEFLTAITGSVLLLGGLSATCYFLAKSIRRATIMKVMLAVGILLVSVAAIGVLSHDVNNGESTWLGMGLGLGLSLVMISRLRREVN